MQIGYLDLRQDEELISQTLTSPEISSLHLASPYFNMTPRHLQQIVSGRSAMTLLCAAPRANG